MTETAARPTLTGRRALTGVACWLALGCGAALGQSAPPITLVYETRVEISAKILLHGPAETSHEVEEVLAGLAGDRLAMAKQFPSAAGPLAVGLIVEARPDEGTGRCSLRIESEVRRHTAEAVTATRDAEVESGRLLLTDIWSDAQTGTKLVLALVANWKQVPTISTLVPGAEPLDLLVEVLLGHGADEEVVERHRLGGLVGSRISYTFRQLPGTESVGARSPDEIGELKIEVLPHEIRAGKADLDIKIEHLGASPYSKIATMNLSLRERLAPGHSVSLPLPRAVDGAPLVFRVTPYF